ncbi:DUF5105 domain-containing protein [Bacillus sp. NPDC077027]|uniref:DUF5105 domain-containing protein n=1 Tax=Bacillus sp. NPDC077027 TaxID=3390548 RepID=UPI003D075983
MKNKGELIVNFKKISFVLLMTVMMVFTAACQSSGKKADADNNKSKANKTTEVKVESYEYVLPESSTTTLREEELVLKVNVSVKNKGNEPLSFSNLDFTLYQNDSKVSDLSFYGNNDRLQSGSLNKDKSAKGALYYLVDKGKTYQLSYKKRISDKNEDPIEFDIDGKKILETADKLQDPAKALLAYTDVVVYGEENENFVTLTGDNKSDIVNKYNEAFIKGFKRSAGLYSTEINDSDIKALLDRMKKAMKEKTKVEATVQYASKDEATVMAKVTPIDASSIQDKMRSRKAELSSGNDSQAEIMKKALKIYSDEFDKLSPASSAEEIKVTMKRKNDDQWQLDMNHYSSTKFMDAFIKN